MTDIVERLRAQCHCNLETSPCGAEEECRLDAEAADEIERLREAKDSAYRERNQCVALIAAMALASGWRAGLAKTDIEGWSEDWHGCVYIDLPSGQVSWHFHDNQAGLFDFLPAYQGIWDGHDTPEKYRRIAKDARMFGSVRNEVCVPVYTPSADPAQKPGQ